MKGIEPPRLAQKIFEWFCRDTAVEDLRGDMEELFHVNLERMSVRKAKSLYWLHTLSLVTSYAVRKRKRRNNKFSSTEYNMDMLKSYFLIATRSLAKHKFFTSINVLGLAIGMSISLLLITLITFVATFDDFHVNKDRIYRVISKTNVLNNREFARTPLPLAENLQSEYPGIEEVIRISSDLSGEAEFDGKQIPMKGFFVDSHFLNVFSFPLLKGNVTTALEKPKSMIITEEGAQRMFGTEDPMGKVINLKKFGEFEVTGVLKQLPKNSHIKFELLVPFQAFEISKSSQKFIASDEKWSDLNIYTYLLLPKTFSEDAPQRIDTFLDKIAKKVYSKNSEFVASFKLQPLSDIVPGNDLALEIGQSWDTLSFIMFGILTLLILLPACFNYANISISRAIKRSKEIGLRKVVGGQRNQIFFQFILETIIVTLLALGLAYVFFVIIRNELIPVVVDSLILDLTPTAITILYFVGFAIFVGFVAGAVPALFFAKLNPIQALKSKSSSRASGGSMIRKVLIVGQFALSLGFIMAVTITIKQHAAALNYNFGFDKENILDVELQGVDPNIFRNEFSKLSSVQSISMSSNIMGASNPTRVWIQKPKGKDSTDVVQMFVDHNYLSNLNIKLVAGKHFPDQREGREQFVIVNEEFLKRFEITSPVDALGETILVPDAGELVIIGVAKNFHYTDLKMQIQGFFFRYNPKMFSYANLKVTSSDMYATLTNMETVWESIGGEKKLQARFFDDEIEEAYAEYYSSIKIYSFLAFLAISISCLGLLGMVVYTTETRIKEIGVRKALGASTSTIAMLLSKDYLKLMLTAALIATPITYFFFDTVLFGQHANKITIGALEIVASILIMFLLGIGTILSQTLKASRANPVDTLRYE